MIVYFEDENLVVYNILNEYNKISIKKLLMNHEL